MCILQLLGMVLIYMSILFVGLFTYLLIYFLICSINEPKPESGFLKLRMKLKDVSQTEEYRNYEKLKLYLQASKGIRLGLFSEHEHIHTHTHPNPTPLHLPWHFSFPDLTGWFISCFTKLVTSCLPDFHPVLPCCIGHLAELPWLSLQGGNPDESWVCLLPHLQMEGDQDPVQHHLKQEDIETHEYFITKWPSSANILIFSLVVSFVFTF